MQQPTYLEIAAQAVQARARIRNHIYETPLIPSRTNSEAAGSSKLLFKAENFQLTGSFKIRGAMAKMSAVAAQNAITTSSSSSSSSSAARLVTASSGNHGIGAALAAKLLHQDLTVVLPETVVPSKLRQIQSHGARVVVHGAETGLAEQHAQRLDGHTYVSPYNDADVIAGQASVALEMLEQCVGGGVDNVFVALGGGGLVSGIGAVCKAFSPRTKVYGVAAANSMALALSMRARRIVETDHLPTLADAVAGGIDPDAITLPLALAVVDDVVVCQEADIAAAMRSLAFGENMVVEGAAALAFAGYLSLQDRLLGQTSVVVLCGANYDQAVMARTLHG